MTVIILAAGLGTRMNSDIPKVMHKLRGRPMIGRVLDTAKSFNDTDIILVLGHGRETVEKYVRKDFHGRAVSFVFQETQAGSGDAVKTAASLVDKESDMLILEGDAPLVTPESLKDFIGRHQKSGAALSFISFEKDNPKGYGRVVRDFSSGGVSAIVEEKDASPETRKIREVNSGIYFGNSKKIFAALSVVGNNNAKKEYYLTDIVKIMLAGGEKVLAINFGKTGEFMGVNTQEELFAAERLFVRV